MIHLSFLSDASEAGGTIESRFGSAPPRQTTPRRGATGVDRVLVVTISRRDVVYDGLGRCLGR